MTTLVQWLCGVFTNHFPINSVDDDHVVRISCRRCKRPFGNPSQCGKCALTRRATTGPTGKE